MTTQLDRICAIVPNLDIDCSEHISWLTEERENKKRTLSIKLLSAYNGDRQRVLYAFSCFEKDILTSKETGELIIHITYLSDEEEYVLSKIRTLVNAWYS